MPPRQQRVASNAEALSRVLAAAIYPKELTPPGIGGTFATASTWLQSSRPDWVNKPEGTDLNFVSIGCGTLFINWLCFGLGYSLTQIVGAGGSTLAQTYTRLTGRDDWWTRFIDLVNRQFPPGQGFGRTTDNPFTADILWYNSSTGESQIWFMDGNRRAGRATVVTDNGLPTLIGPPFSIVGGLLRAF